jgi:hypothetical protein
MLEIDAMVQSRSVSSSVGTGDKACRRPSRRQRRPIRRRLAKKIPAGAEGREGGGGRRLTARGGADSNPGDICNIPNPNRGFCANIRIAIINLDPI